MVTDEVVAWAKEQFEAGQSVEAIKLALRSTGWAQDDIEEIMARTGAAEEVSDIIAPESSNEMVTSTPSGIKSVVYWCASGILAVSGFFAVSALTSPKYLMMLFSDDDAQSSIYITFMLVAAALSLLLLAITTFVTVLVKRSSGPVYAYGMSVSLYVLGSFLICLTAAFVIYSYRMSAPAGVKFAIGLIASFFNIYLVWFLYVGFVLQLCLSALLMSLGKAGVDTRVSNRKRIVFFIIFLIAFTNAAYVFGFTKPIAEITNIQSLCRVVYSDKTKRECYLKSQSGMSVVSGTDEKSGSGSEFTLIETDYRDVKNLAAADGKLAYSFQQKQQETLLSGVVLGDEVIYTRDPNVARFGSMEVVSIDNKLAYTKAVEGGVQLFWGEEPYGNVYTSINRLSEIAGLPAYSVNSPVEDGPCAVWGTKEYGAGFDKCNLFKEGDGKIVFSATKNDSLYYIVGDETYGPFSTSNADEFPKYSLADGSLVTINNEDGEFSYTFKGETYGQGVQRFHGFEVIEGTLTFEGKKDSRKVLVHGDVIIDDVLQDNRFRIYDINDTLGYFQVKENGDIQLKVGETYIGPIFTDSVGAVSVSEKGQVAISKEVDDETEVYLNNELIYTGKVGKKTFVGEKLVMTVLGNGVPAIWYEGKVVGYGFSSHLYSQVLVDGKLAVSGYITKDSNSGLVYSILREQ